MEFKVSYDVLIILLHGDGLWSSPHEARSAAKGIVVPAPCGAVPASVSPTAGPGGPVAADASGGPAVTSRGIGTSLRFGCPSEYRYFDGGNGRREGDHPP